MRAVRVHAFGAPSVLHVETVPVPSISNNQVLVKVLAAGINPVEASQRGLGACIACHRDDVKFIWDK